MISQEVKLNFGFYSTFVLFGVVGAIFFYVISVTLAIPGLMFLAIVSLGSGILTAWLFHRGEKKSGNKQTSYMKKLAVKFLGKEPGSNLKEAKKAMGVQKGSLMDNIIEEAIPPVEIVDVAEEVGEVVDR